MWQIFSISWSDIQMLWRDLFILISWFAGISYLVSGVQDIFSDGSSLVWRIIKAVRFRKRMRLSLRLLRALDQQHLAVYVPAWDEADIIGNMLESIIGRAEYERYIVFVGTYPNDPATQASVDRVAAQHPRVIKVVTSTPGPTTKADCLNHIYQAMQEYEEHHHINFDIILMHDAEDLVHPFEMLVLNYLIPRIDAVQMPILAMPTKHSEWVHWVYADEFVIHHMKDMMVREFISGFIPFAGVGMGFARRTFHILEAEDGLPLFNEGLLTEDYALGKRLHDLGLHVAFVNVILADDPSPWYVPLSQRPHFVTNWAFFPMTFNRSVRQKTRWITGISIQEWERSGWKGNFWLIENFIKDRKTFFSMAVTFLGYLVLIYMLIYWLERIGFLPHWLEPVVLPGTPLFTLLTIDMFFLISNLFLRLFIVSWVYGPVAGILSLPRIFVANAINGMAAFRAFHQFLDSKITGQRLRWDKTHHVEGMAQLPSDIQVPQEDYTTTVDLSVDELLAMLSYEDVARVKHGLQSIQAPFPGEDQTRVVKACLANVKHARFEVRACVARALVAMNFDDSGTFIDLLKDHSWVVRAATARAVVGAQRASLLIACFDSIEDNKYGRDILARTAGNRVALVRELRPELQLECLGGSLLAQQLPLMAETQLVMDDERLEVVGGR